MNVRHRGRVEAHHDVVVDPGGGMNHLVISASRRWRLLELAIGREGPPESRSTIPGRMLCACH